MNRLRRYWFTIVGLLLALLVTRSSFAVPPETTEWGDVQHLIGLEGIPPQARGTFFVQGRSLAFFFAKDWQLIPLDRVQSIEVSLEHQETGGALGKITRVAIPYGGGSLLGLATQRTIGVLTIRYGDTRMGLHEAVLAMPLDEASDAQMRLASLIGIHGATASSRMNCTIVTEDAPALRVILAGTENAAPEYEALIYEHLLGTIRTLWPEAVVLRGNSEQASCRVASLTIMLTDANKGNGVARAVTGPVGLFVGVTRVRAEAVVRDAAGTLVWQRSYHATRRGDRESLGAASSVASSMAHDLKHTAWSPAALGKERP